VEETTYHKLGITNSISLETTKMGLIHKIEEKVLHHGDKKYGQQDMYALIRPRLVPVSIDHDQASSSATTTAWLWPTELQSSSRRLQRW
jgi:hypothetical protein